MGQPLPPPPLSQALTATQISSQVSQVCCDTAGKPHKFLKFVVTQQENLKYMKFAVTQQQTSQISEICRTPVRGATSATRVLETNIGTYDEQGCLMNKNA
jgi:hypothetical protein